MSSDGSRLVIWSPRAIRDLNGIHGYIAQFAPQTADRFTDRLIAAVESLADRPERGRTAGRFRELVAISPMWFAIV